jgi:hypothetical protein
MRIPRINQPEEPEMHTTIPTTNTVTTRAIPPLSALRRLATALVTATVLSASAAGVHATEAARGTPRGTAQEAGWCGQQADGDRTQKEALCNAFASAPAGRGDAPVPAGRFAPEDWNGPAFGLRADPVPDSSKGRR